MLKKISHYIPIDIILLWGNQACGHLHNWVRRGELGPVRVSDGQDVLGGAVGVLHAYKLQLNLLVIIIFAVLCGKTVVVHLKFTRRVV